MAQKIYAEMENREWARHAALCEINNQVGYMIGNDPKNKEIYDSLIFLAPMQWINQHTS